MSGTSVLTPDRIAVSDGAPAQPLCAAPPRSRLSPETHAAVLELKTGVHRTAAGAVAEAAAIRERLSLELAGLGLVAASAGVHPLASAQRSKLSGAPRYGAIGDSMRCSAHREPTMALHVHVGVAGADDAIAVLNVLRAAIPILIALSANSPFMNGEDSGFWIGTVEVRAMDARSSAAEAAPPVALIQSLARLTLQDRPPDGAVAPEILEENRFLAARDGIDARVIDPTSGDLVPIRRLVHELCEACRPHAEALGSLAELERLEGWAMGRGAHGQRTLACTSGVEAVLPALAARFAPVARPSSHSVHRSARSH